MFWDFFKSLKWILISTAGPVSALVKGGASVLDSVIDDIKWLRDQFSPETCEDISLSKHGRARGIIQRDNETIESYRIRVCNGFAWQLRGGRKSNLPVCLDDHGYPDCTVINLRDEDSERWAEFRIELPPFNETKIMKAEDYIGIAEVCNDQKPARSKLASVRIQEDTSRDQYFSGIVSQVNIQTIEAE
ncbi:MAG: hypothetical protein GY760_21265 [Deltaproteobacteria bacterium]|nr:hypothetical protein [Deltaproteobacteria bacterium]